MLTVLVTGGCVDSVRAGIGRAVRYSTGAEDELNMFSLMVAGFAVLEGWIDSGRTGRGWCSIGSSSTGPVAPKSAELSSYSLMAFAVAEGMLDGSLIAVPGSIYNGLCGPDKAEAFDSHDAKEMSEVIRLAGPGTTSWARTRAGRTMAVKM